jgi:hypothetical protein
MSRADAKLKAETRRALKHEVIEFLRGIKRIDKDMLERVKKEKPFQAVIFSAEAILYAKQERSVVTKMGITLFPNLAAIVARDRYTDVHKDHDLHLAIDAGSMSKVDVIVNELRAPGRSRRPNHVQEIREITAAANGQKSSTTVRADLYVGDYPTGPLFLEIKSPMPNLDICAESKKKFLIFETSMRAKGGRAYFGFAYNPYITREAYAWGITKAIMDMDAEVLMGSEMWDKLGGDGTYEELLNVLAEAGKEANPKA